MLILRGLDICQQAPLKTRTQAVLQAMNGFGRAIARHHDLLIRAVQRIEGMEKFLLGRLFARDKLDIIHQQDINLAIFGAELLSFLEANGIDDFIRKFFRGHVQNRQTGSLSHMSNGMQQMRLS